MISELADCSGVLMEAERTGLIFLPPCMYSWRYERSSVGSSVNFILFRSGSSKIYSSKGDVFIRFPSIMDVVSSCCTADSMTGGAC